MLMWIGVSVAAYFVGSLPFGVWIARLRGVDILAVGSGNPGATNVARAAGKAAGLLTLLLDVMKGMGPSLVGGFAAEGGFRPDVALGIGALAVVGHMYSPFIRFRGGKGVATALGVVLAAAPIPSLICLAFWVLVLVLFDYVSLASIVAVCLMPLCTYLLGYPLLITVGILLIAAFIVVKHRPNLVRLAAGTENRFRFRGPANSHETPEPKE